MRKIIMVTSIFRVEDLVNIDEYRLSENIIIQTLDFTPAYLEVEENFMMIFPICQDNSFTEEEVFRMECGHLYHKSCLIKWLEVSENKSCPMFVEEFKIAFVFVYISLNFQEKDNNI